MVAGLAALAPYTRLFLGEVKCWAVALGEDVASILPDVIRGRLYRPTNDVRVGPSPMDGSLEATLPDGRRLRVDAAPVQAELREAARRHLVILHVPNDEVLSTVLRLPRRATRRLDEVVATNVSVWTPFSADDAYVKACVSTQAARSVNGKPPSTIPVELRCVSKASIEPWISLCAAHRVPVDEIWLGPDRSFRVSLGSLKTRTWRRHRRRVLALVGSAMLQLGVLIVIDGQRQDDELAALEAHLAQVRASVIARTARLEAAKVATRTLADVKARATGRGSATHALSLLAKARPGGVSYRDVTLTYPTGGSMTIVSKDRIDPVAVVAASRMFTVTEVNELGGPQETDHVYAVAFKVLPPGAEPR